jgi:hypothetical protein
MIIVIQFFRLLGEPDRVIVAEARHSTEGIAKLLHDGVHAAFDRDDIGRLVVKDFDIRRRIAGSEIREDVGLERVDRLSAIDIALRNIDCPT